MKKRECPAYAKNQGCYRGYKSDVICMNLQIMNRYVGRDRGKKL